MFKKGIAFITAVALVTSGIVFTPSNADAAVNSNQGSNSWKLVWSDEFNQTVGQAPDTSVWNYDIGHGSNGWGNNELQRYTDSTNNVYIADLSSDSGSSDGRALAIKAQKEGSEYTSGRIQTQNKQYCKFGRIETKLRVENGSQSGVWPAFWMLGQNYNASGNNWNGAYGASPWPSCGEIDIMEHRNAETQVIGTLHWNPSTTNYEHVYAGSETTNSFGAIDTIENWHTYAIEWYEDCMKWYVDGICYQTMNISSEQMDEFQRDHFIILNLALGSNSSPFTLNQTVSANFTNATMYVDYVRVFQGNDASFSIKNKKEGIAQPETTTNRFSSMTSINNDGNMHNIGQWNYLFAGSWTGTSGYYKGGTDLNDLEVYIGSNNNASEEWGAQLKTNALSLNAGKTYNYSISIESDKAGAEVLLKNDTDGIELQRKTLTNGKNIFAGTITSEKGNAELIFALGKVAAGTTLKVTDFTISDSSGEITTKAPETTKVSETTTKIAETTTASGNKPEKPFGLVVNCPSDNTISVVWGNVVGNLYNIYIDGVKVKEAVGCAEYRFEGYSVGSHTVEVCTIKDGIESDKISGTVNVTGKGEITTKAPETTKVSETTTKIAETTTASGNKPEKPFGLVVNCPSDNTISVVWGNVVGNLYNIYIDGVKVKEAVGCAEYRFEGYSVGSHTVEVCTIKDGIESDKISGTVNVTGKGEITTKTPETTTKIAETTTKKPEQTTNKQEQTTKTPETTTKIAETTTKKPEQTTNKQEQTTKTPETTTKIAETTTKKPEQTTNKQEQTTKTPETTTKIAETTTKKPEQTTNKQEQTIKVTEATNNDGANQSTIQPTADKNILTVGKAKITKKKSLKKKIKITLKRVTNAKGYIVQYSTSKKFTKKTTKTINVAKTTVVLKKLKSNKKYYIRVRGYAVSNDEKVYGKWSGKTSVKTK